MTKNDRFDDESSGSGDSDLEEGSHDSSEEESSEEGSEGGSEEGSEEGSDESESDKEDDEEDEDEDVKSEKDEDSEDGSEEDFEDEGSESSEDSEESDESGSEYDSESDLSESDEGQPITKDREAGGFFDEEEQESWYSGILHRFRKIYVIGIAVGCVVILALAIGLGVGLGMKKDDDNEPVTAAPIEAPTNAPVRFPIVLPDPPKMNEPDTVEIAGYFFAQGDNSIFPNGGELNGDMETMLVRGESEDPENPPAYSLVEVSLDPEQFRYILMGSAEVEFCLEHVPRENKSGSDMFEEVVTYSICVIDSEKQIGDGDLIVDSLNGETASYVMPDDCVNSLVVDFDVRPSNTEICIDVTEIFMPALMETLQVVRRGLRGSSNNNVRSLQSEKVFVFMIDQLGLSSGPGDEFYTKENTEQKKAPSLTISAEAKPDCNTIGACRDETPRCFALYPFPADPARRNSLLLFRSTPAFLPYFSSLFRSWSFSPLLSSRRSLQRSKFIYVLYDDH